MNERDHKAGDGNEPGTGKTGTLPPAEHVKGDDCRCEEVSKMTPRQLLETMLSDLAFWKKRERDKQRKS